MNKTEKERLLFNWQFWRRPNQTPPPGSWRVWLILAGRGFGKTRTGAETVREWVKKYPLTNLIGATSDDARDIMIEGESGILAICPKDERPVYVRNASKLEWPNGARSLIFTADTPERLRGKQSMKLWADELAAWRYPEAWDQALMGLRLGDNPQAIVTTTPKPTKIIKGLLSSKTTAVTRGTTYDNRSNLADAFFDEIIKRYEGTRLGRQELNAEVLEDIEGALWKWSLIDQYRVEKAPSKKATTYGAAGEAIITEVPALARIVIAIDPAVSTSEISDETGIISVGLGEDKAGYILGDASGIYSPLSWANHAIAQYNTLKADCIVAEVNQGGDLVEANLRAAGFRGRVQKVHASRGKAIRAEPIAALYEQGRIHHVGSFPQLEQQMTTWAPATDDSPDRLDALVWGLTSIMFSSTTEAVADPFSDW